MSKQQKTTRVVRITHNGETFLDHLDPSEFAVAQRASHGGQFGLALSSAELRMLQAFERRGWPMSISEPDERGWRRVDVLADVEEVSV